MLAEELIRPWSMVSDILSGQIVFILKLFLKFKMKYCGVVKGKHQREKLIYTEIMSDIGTDTLLQSRKTQCIFASKNGL